MKNMSKGKKRILQGTSLLLVAALIVTLFANVNIARSLSLQYIEQIKKDYSDSSFKILEIAPSADNGTIGYYANGQEPAGNWAQTASEFSGRSVRVNYVNKIFDALKAKKLLGDGDSTPLRTGSKYKELYPWENISNDSTKKTVTALLRESGHENDYNEMKLADSEIVSSYADYDSDGKPVQMEVTGKMTSLEDALAADSASVNIADFEYNAKYNYRLADSSEKNLYNFYELSTKLGNSIQETYRTTRIITPNNQTEAVTVFGTTQNNWKYYYNSSSLFYDLTKTYAQSNVKNNTFYQIPVESGATYKLTFKAKVVSDIEIKKDDEKTTKTEITGNGKAQVMVIPYTQEGKTISYSPNNSKQYWLLNKYISQPTQTSAVDSRGFAEYTYYFTTPKTSIVSYIQIRFDVAELSTSATFKAIKLNKYTQNHFDMYKWAGNQKNLVNGDSSSQASIKADLDYGRITVKMTKGTKAYSKIGTASNLYYMEVEPYTQYVLTYHVEDTMDDGGRSLVQIMGFDEDMEQDFAIPKDSNVKGIRQEKSDSYSVQFVTGSETKYIGISFGVESKTSKKVSHTSVYSNIAIVKAGEFEQEEPPTHVQNIDYFTYGETSSNDEAKLGESVFNFGDWVSSLSSQMSGACNGKGSVVTDYEQQTITVKCYPNKTDVYTNYISGSYTTGFYYIKVTPGMTYKVSYHVNNNLATKEQGSHFYVFAYDSEKNPYNFSTAEAGNVLLNNEVSVSGDVECEFTCPSGVEYIQIRVGSRRAKTSGSEQTVTFSNIKIRPYDQTSYYYNVKFTEMEDYYVEAGVMSTKDFEYEEGVDYYYNSTTYTAKTFQEIEALEENVELYTRDRDYVFAGEVGKDGFTFDPSKTYYTKGLIKYNEIKNTENVSAGTTVYTYEWLDTYTLAGTKGSNFEYDPENTYYTASSGFHKKPLTQFGYEEKVYTKSGDNDYVYVGTIYPSGFTISDETELYTRKDAPAGSENKYEYTVVSDWSKITYGTTLYSYFYDLALYKKDERTGHAGEFIYVGKIGRDYTYAGTFDTDEFTPVSGVQYYVYDSENDRYKKIDTTEMETGMVLFTESTVFKGNDSSYTYFDTFTYDNRNTFLEDNGEGDLVNKTDYYTFDAVSKKYDLIDVSSLTEESDGTLIYVLGESGYTYMDKDTTYYYASINYDYDGCPVSAIWDEDHPYCVTTNDFREATDDEVPYFIEDGVDHYIYVGSGNGDYRYSFSSSSITIETDTVFYNGGFTNNNWMLRYVFDYTLDEIANGKDSLGHNIMGISVTTVEPTVLNNMLDEDLESYLGQFDLIVISSGLSLIGSNNYSNDISDSTYTVLKDVITGTMYTTPTIVDTTLFNIEYTDRYGSAIENIPKLAKELCEEVEAGGVQDHIYRFNYDDLPNSTATDNTTIANDVFAGVITTYTDETADLEIKPYYDVYSDIKTENSMRTSQRKDLLTNDKITEATAIRTILNCRGRQKENHKETITVLELQPYTSTPATGSSVIHGEYYGTTISSDSGLTKDMVLSWFPTEAGFTKDDITIKTMAINEFIGRNEDLSETYDILYVGSSLTNMNYRVYGELNSKGKLVNTNDRQYELDKNGQPIWDTAEDGTKYQRLNTEWQKVYVPNYNDDEMDGLFYTNVGDLYYVQSGKMAKSSLGIQTNGHSSVGVLGGLMASDYTYRGGLYNRWEVKADDASNTDNHAFLQVRSSGNDITTNKLAEIQNFIDAGHPVVLSSRLCENDWSGDLKVAIEESVEVDASGNSWAKLVAKYTGTKLPTGVQPKYTWYIGGQQLKETDKEYTRYVTYSDLDGDGIKEGIYRFPLDITKVDERYNKEYYVQLSSFKFNSGKYQSLTNYTKPISNKVTLVPNTLSYSITVKRDDKYNAHADMTVTTSGSVMPKPNPESKTVYSNEYTIATDDAKYSTQIYYSWRNRSVGGEWRELAYCNWTSYEYNDATSTYTFKFNNSDKKVLGISFPRPYVDLKIDLISSKFGNVHIFTNASDAYCNQLAPGQTYSYSRSINYPDWTEGDKGTVGSSGTGSFSLRSERVDNSSNLYAVLYPSVEQSNVFSTSDFENETSIKKNMLLNTVNISKPLIENLTEDEMKIYNSSKTITKWQEDEVVDLGTNPTIEYNFQITNPTDMRIRSTRYYCNVYLDLDGDGKFTDEEQLKSDEYTITKTSGVSTDIASGDLRNYWVNESGTADTDSAQNRYKLMIRLGGDYIGIIPWKMEIVKVGDSTVHNSFVGYAYNRPTTPYELNVLQILPVTVDTEKGLSGTTYYMNKWSTELTEMSSTQWQKCSIFLDKVFSNLPNVTRTINTENKCIDFSIGDDYIVHIYVTSVLDLQWPGYEGTDFKEYCADGVTRQTLYDKFNTYDMLIVGFGDCYANGVSEELAQAVDDYIDTGKSVLYTHDATDQFNNFYPKQRQADGYYLNLYVRDAVGQDKYGITYNILSHSETNRSKASRGKSNRPERFGYSDNIYTGGSVFYHYDYSAVTYNRWSGTTATATTPANGEYIEAKDNYNKTITGLNRYPAIIYLDSSDKWVILCDADENPVFIKDYEVDSKGRVTVLESTVTTVVKDVSYKSRVDQYGVGDTYRCGILVYYDSEHAKWEIAYDANGDFMTYNSDTYVGWVYGYDANGHVLTSDNTYPTELNYVNGKWEIEYQALSTTPKKTPNLYIDKYGKTADGTKWHGAYTYLDQNTMTWKIGYDAQGNIITYGVNGYDVDDAAGSPSVSFELTKDATTTMTNNISKFSELGYQIAYMPNSARETTVSEVQGFTTYTMARYTRDYKSSDQVGITAKLGNTGGKTNTNKVTQVNRGQITMYPFNLNTDEFRASSTLDDTKHLSIGDTHEQYYTLDLTGTYHEDTNTYEDDYATVWYCLGGDNYEDNVRNDCANTYYMYRFGNVTYTGAGHTNQMSSDEAKLFINVIVASHVKTGDSANIEVTGADTKATTESIIVRCTTEEISEDDGTTKNRYVPDVRDEENKYILKLDTVQSNVMIKMWYVDSDGNRVEIFYDDLGNPHTVTFNDDGFITKIDGEGPTETQVHTTSGTLSSTYPDSKGNNITYTCNYAAGTTTYVFKGKNADGSTAVYYATYLTDKSEESGCQIVSFITPNRFKRQTEINGLHRLRQDLYYEATVYDDDGNPHTVVFTKKNLDGKNIIISFDGNKLSEVRTEEYLSKYYVDKAKTNHVTMDRLVGKPISEYEISYSIPQSVFEYLASLEDSANLKFYFQVLSCDGNDMIYKTGKVTDVSMVKSGLKTLV